MLAEWEEVFAAGVRIKLLDTETSRTIKDFLGVVPDEGFAEYWRHRIEDQGLPSNLDFYSFLQKYRQSRSARESAEVRPHAAFTSSPTFGGRTSRSHCLCGEMHSFADLILAQRSEGWTPDPDIQKRIDEKLLENHSVCTVVKNLPGSAYSAAAKGVVPSSMYAGYVTYIPPPAGLQVRFNLEWHKCARSYSILARL